MKNTVTCMKKILVLAAALCLALCVFGAGCVDNDEPSGGGGASSGEELDVKVGDSFTIGTYKDKPLSWKVIALDAKNERVLLLADTVLDAMYMYQGSSGSTWKDSSIRAYLNGEFYNDAFSDAEKADIVSVTLSNPAHSLSDRSGDAATVDSVFLLSEEEVLLYLPNEEDRIVSDGVADSEWWLRTAGWNADDDYQYFILVWEWGSIDNIGLSPTDVDYAVRPAFWLDLSADEEE